MSGPRRQPDHPPGAGYDHLRVTCTLAPEDWIGLGLAAAAPSWRITIGCGLFVGVPGLAWLVLDPDRTLTSAILSLFPALSIAMVALVWIALHRLGLRRQLRHAVATDGASYPLGPQLLAIGPLGLFHESPVTRARTSWAFVERLTVDRDRVVLHSGPRSAWMVPRRAFASTEELDRFVEAARRWHSQPVAAEAAVQADPGEGHREFDLSFALTVQDYEAVVRWATREATRVTPKQVILLCVAALVAITPWALPGLALGTELRVLSALFLAAAIAGTPSLWAHWLVPGSVRRARRRYPARFPLRSQQVCMGPAGIVQVTENGRFEESWARIQRVVEDRDHFYLYNGPATAFLVPKRAFAHEDHAARFHARARAWQEEAPRLPPREAAPLRDPATAPADPFAPPG